MALLQSCANVQIKDSAWIGPYPDKSGAVEFHTLTVDSKEYTPQEFEAWLFDANEPVLCTKAIVFGDWKSVIEKLCSISDRCTYEEKEAIKKFFSRVDRFQGMISNAQHR